MTLATVPDAARAPAPTGARSPTTHSPLALRGPSRPMTTVAGVDWAGTGWFAVVLDADALDVVRGNDADALHGDTDAGAEAALDAATDVYPSLLNVVHETGADAVLVDVPVGLPAEEPRACDAAAREAVGPERAGSVFPTPCRAAVYAPTYEAAKAENEAALGRSVTVQAWNIVPCIREADALLDAVPAARDAVREAHPEVCLRALAGEPLAHPKTTDEGVAERLSALENVGAGPSAADADAGLPALYETLVERFVTGPEPHARRLPADAADDVLDALALAATAVVGPSGDARSGTSDDAWSGTSGDARSGTSGDEPGETGGWSLATLPSEPPTDERGLPMEIVYPERVHTNGK